MFKAITSICKGETDKNVREFSLSKGVVPLMQDRYVTVTMPGPSIFDAVQALYTTIKKMIDDGKSITFEQKVVIVINDKGEEVERIPIED